ncbi:acetoin reductase [Rubrobacter marinus]|uniref:acetoin reductase n=1 Tax=Rubrobacter marinus TaxID=2653852 RepID=UPI001A9DF0DA|nr:acetoin reductase [Rubrobacter marinus]
MVERNGSARVALVTGAARGIGRGIALRLAEDGLDVAVNDVGANEEGLNEVAEEIRGVGRRTATIVADVSRADEVEGMVGRVAEELGRLDVMVANAGVAQVAPLLEVTPEDFDRLMAVNLKGVFLCYTAAARQMIRQGGGGKIIGAASIAAHKGFAMLGHYSASKWGVRGLTQAAAQEWAEHGITVNAYCPGIVGTAMWDLIDEKLSEHMGIEKGGAIKQYSELIALGRVETPEDVASFVSYLASGDSDYMTGQSVMIDGGIIFS